MRSPHSCKPHAGETSQASPQTWSLTVKNTFVCLIDESDLEVTPTVRSRSSPPSCAEIKPPKPQAPLRRIHSGGCESDLLVGNTPLAVHQRQPTAAVRRSTKGLEETSTTYSGSSRETSVESSVLSPPQATPTTRKLAYEWTLRADEIDGVDKVRLPTFSMPILGLNSCQFQVTLYSVRRGPKKRNSTTFGRAEGCGRLEVKCLQESMGVQDSLQLGCSVTVGMGERAQRSGDAEVHDFVVKSCRSFRGWDFASAADPATRSIKIRLDLQIERNSQSIANA